MVECSKCETWLHLKCAGLRRNNIPDIWYCSKCKISQKKSDININTNNTNNKLVSGSRKRKSTKTIQQKTSSKKKSLSSDVEPIAAPASSTSISQRVSKFQKSTACQMKNKLVKSKK